MRGGWARLHAPFKWMRGTGNETGGGGSYGWGVEKGLGFVGIEKKIERRKSKMETAGKIAQARVFRGHTVVSMG